MLITQWWCSCCWTVLTPSQGHSSFPCSAHEEEHEKLRGSMARTWTGLRVLGLWPWQAQHGCCSEWLCHQSPCQRQCHSWTWPLLLQVLEFPGISFGFLGAQATCPCNLNTLPAAGRYQNAASWSHQTLKKNFATQLVGLNSDWGTALVYSTLESGTSAKLPASLQAEQFSSVQETSWSLECHYFGNPGYAQRQRYQC